MRVVRQNLARAFRDEVPYVVALIDLDEGARLMSNVVGCDPDDVSVRPHSLLEQREQQTSSAGDVDHRFAWAEL